jgi:hypothetical protein
MAHYVLETSSWIQDAIEGFRDLRRSTSAFAVATLETLHVVIEQSNVVSKLTTT